MNEEDLDDQEKPDTANIEYKIDETKDRIPLEDKIIANKIESQNVNIRKRPKRLTPKKFMIIKNSRITDYMKPDPKSESKEASKSECKEASKSNNTQITLSKSDILRIK